MTELTNIGSLNANDIKSILKKAALYVSNGHKTINHNQTLEGIIAVNLFFENSTRTCSSFQIAQRRHGIISITPSIDRSSLSKGETIEDTVLTFEAMGCSLFVIRHQDPNVIEKLVSIVSQDTHIISAGSGTLHHPTQALIDLFTISATGKRLDEISIAIIGDITHSRVAHSLATGLHIMGNKHIRAIAPPAWHSPNIPAQQFTDMNKGLENADVIMCLRVQNERLDDSDHYDVEKYQQQFCLTNKRLALAKPDAIVIHPGPINRGIEITSAIADSPQSCILQQVMHSVPVRMAIIDYMFAQ